MARRVAPGQTSWFHNDVPRVSVAPRSPTDEFFDRKRPWSRIKDTILANYQVPYLRKVRTLGSPILIVDAFAGPGQFESGELGSPLLLLDAAEEHVAGQYRAFFANKNPAHHAALEKAIRDRGLGSHVQTQLGDCGDLLQRLGVELQTRCDVAFLYLDPFGLRGVEMDRLEGLLSRSKSLSTELLINLNTPTIKRLAHRFRADADHLDAVLGGSWWRDVKAQNGGPDEYVAGYLERLKAYGFDYAGACAVRDVGTLRYHLAFCSRHRDAALLMNDIMLNAIDKHSPGSRQAENLYLRLDEVVLDQVRRTPGIQRSQLWLRLLTTDFARFKSAEFNAAVKALRDNCSITMQSDTGRLNDTARLFPQPSDGTWRAAG